MASLRQRTLQSALQIVGDTHRLMRRLRVPMSDLRAWLEGREEAPTAVFLAAVDIVAAVEPISNQQTPPRRERRARPRDAVLL
jgi:hypothetical protein